MPVTRIWVLAAMMAGATMANVRGDAMLTLGTFSSGSPSASTSGSSNSAQAGGFTIGDASTSGATPGITPPSASGNNLATSNPVSQSNNTSTGSSTASAPSQPNFDAFINLGAGPYPGAGTLTTGNALPWYDSPKVVALFGGQPTASQQSAFDSAVLQRVQQTFQLSKVPVTLTDDPKATAAHTLSVVSNAVNPSLGNAIGMTNLGGDGFHFIDNSAPHAGSVDQLEWIVAHNVAHELMLAFGVPETHDQSGNSIDSTSGNLAMFLNPNATFSTGAAEALLAQDFKATNGLGLSSSPQLIAGSNVPEPATFALWGLGAIAVVIARRGRPSVSLRTA